MAARGQAGGYAARKKIEELFCRARDIPGKAREGSFLPFRSTCKSRKKILGGIIMKKEETLFWLLRTLVRQGELRPAYARQIYLRHMESSGKKIPFGHALWLNRGWEYDG